MHEGPTKNLFRLQMNRTMYFQRRWNDHDNQIACLDLDRCVSSISFGSLETALVSLALMWVWSNPSSPIWQRRLNRIGFDMFWPTSTTNKICCPRMTWNINGHCDIVHVVLLASRSQELNLEISATLDTYELATTFMAWCTFESNTACSHTVIFYG